ncbi:hypothetical protein EXIGLDRAFT_769079 [Exidia glandulosa HHB12029]|uniref:Uncharacterized protein n=1 Tax=Exidia glandulosa HHB12029 TaxID=1314781 RepID=A0A165HQF7_EXIGL|nr:hypothetical protein EXIGLDRAFT_769079 [Exidia glandulosa HHB12029]
MPPPRCSTLPAAATTLETAAAALKVAREATDAIPIAGQILGSAAHIFELAEKIEKKRQAMHDLVTTSANYAHQIDLAVAGRVLEVSIERRLERLYTVFAKIEALFQRETAPQRAILRILHQVFVLPIRAEALAAELENEMKLFQALSLIDARLAVADTARIVEEDVRYEGDWRRLRHSDVQKLHIVHQYAVADGILTYAGARVDGELMIDAAWFLKHHHHLVWIGDTPLIDEFGEPQIGTFDDLEDEAFVASEHAVERILSALQQVRKPLASVLAEETRVDELYDGRFFDSLAASRVSYAQRALQLWDQLRTEKLAISVEVYRYTSAPVTLPLPESTITHAREHFTTAWEAQDQKRGACDAILHHALLRKQLLQPVHKGWIGVHHCGEITVLIRHTTVDDDGYIRLEEVIIHVPQESHLNAQIKELLRIESLFVGCVYLHEVQCYEEHTDCGFPAACSGPRLVS